MCTLKLFSLTLIYYLHCICYHFVLRYCPFFSRFYIHILWSSVIFKLTYKLEINYIIIIIIILKYPYNGFWCVCYNYVLSSLCLRFNSDLKLTVTIKMLRFSFVLGFVLVLIFFCVSYWPLHYWVRMSTNKIANDVFCNAAQI